MPFAHAQPVLPQPPEATATITLMPKQPRYTPQHAAAGLDAEFPEIETWPNQFPGYEVVIDDPEFTSVCPKTGLPDFGVITLRYQPDKVCLELKSYKEYLHCYRNLGIFQENVVNRVLEDVVRWASSRRLRALMSWDSSVRISSCVPPPVRSAWSACAAFICACARAAWLRRSASSSCTSSWPLRT